MIKTKTLFILGAGASKPFGYPTTATLRDLIQRGSHNKMIAKALYFKNILDCDCLEYVEKFINEFSASGFYSIDNFLEHRPEFMDVGKMAIAAYLIECEYDYKLEKTEGNWYMYLYDRLKSSFDEFEQNDLSFITFNYDRSLEQFLFKALRYSFNKTNHECAVKLNKVPIVHLYGKLDPLPWQNPVKGMIYSNAANLIPRIRLAEHNLKLIDNRRKFKESEVFQKAYDLIAEAHKIYFIGFGFDETNLKRLNVELMRDKILIGTSLGLSTSKKNWIYQYFKKISNVDIHLHELDALAFLEEYFAYETSCC